MDEFSQEARSALAAFKTESGPDAAATEAGWKAFEASVAAGATPQLPAEAAAMNHATAAAGVGGFKGAVVLAALVVAGAGALVLGWSQEDDPPAVPQAPSVRVADQATPPKPKVEPEVEPTPAPLEAPRVETEPERTPPTPRPRAKKRAAEAAASSATGPTSTLGEELEWLQRARKASGRARIEVLDGYQARFAKGSLNAEATLLRAETLCQLGAGEELKALVDAERKHGTRGARLQRLEGVCSKP